MTESVRRSPPTRRPARIKPGSIGTPLPYNEVQARSPEGELLVRGPYVFMGYLNQPEKTAETLDATAGCTPATSAAWTTTAISASPTA